MYDVIGNIIQYSGSNSALYDEFAFNCSGALIIVLTVVFVDLLYRVFRHFWR